MAEGGSLFNPGYLGTEFKWWIGQVADDATWRDNINPGKFKEKDSVPGWGRRYKVRILGMHDWGGTKADGIPDDQLPWANVMYPITAGGNQTSAHQTPAIRQGNVVFGFWMDGSDQEIPVIMGILGNNSQTELSYQTAAKNPKVTNNQPGVIAQSGYAESISPPKELARPTVPDKDLITDKPKSPEQQAECATPPPGMKLNQYGQRPDRPLSKTQFQDAQQARKDIEADDLIDPVSGLPFKNLEEQFGPRYKQEAIDTFVANAVQEGKKNRCEQANSPQAAAVPGATTEAGATSPHIINAGDIKLDDKRNEKVVLVKSDKQVESATTAIQLATENLMAKMEKHMSSQQQYADAVSNPMIDMEKEIDDTSKEIAKYEKIIYNKIMEYTLKKYNKEQTKAVSALPSSKRWQYSDVKEKFTELTLREYIDITNGLAAQMKGTLNKTLDVKGAEASIAAQIAGQTSYVHPDTGETINLEVDDQGNVKNNIKELTSPKVPACFAEDLVGHSIMSFQSRLDKVNTKLLENSNMYLRDTAKEMTNMRLPSGKKANITSASFERSSIETNMVAAFQFLNTKSNVFDFESPRNEAVSDFYQFGRGGGAQADSNIPNMKGIMEQATKHLTESQELPAVPQIPFLEPSKNQPDISWLEGRGAVSVPNLQDIPVSDRTAKQISKMIDNQGNPTN
tara:strand:- start:1682 stop:3727 length:2046 start_codon:yes stop_codon:yes gene_type:complete